MKSGHKIVIVDFMEKSNMECDFMKTSILLVFNYNSITITRIRGYMMNDYIKNICDKYEIEYIDNEYIDLFALAYEIAEGVFNVKPIDARK